MPHIHDQIDFTVEVFIVHNNKVLLRKHDKYGLWLSIGGHIELDEDPNQAALREVKEEVGLEVTLDDRLRTLNPSEENYQELIPPYFLNRHRINEGHEHICLVYFAHFKKGEIINQGREASQAIRWFSQEELNFPELTDRIRQYAEAALKALKTEPTE